MERRKAPKRWEHIQPLLERFGFPVGSSLVSKLCGLRFGFYRGKLISKCRLFTSEKFGPAKAAGIFTGERTIPLMLDYFEKLGSGDAFRRMCILDALILNPDRHYGNFGVLFNTDTMEPISMCPVFDNNRSLFPGFGSGAIG